jgi:hypothetical protein
MLLRVVCLAFVLLSGCYASGPASATLRAELRTTVSMLSESGRPMCAGVRTVRLRIGKAFVHIY